ncbi:MAG: hypothetical protein LBJ25_06260, partial [Candidatus Margulisbacteria bacterium]|nr:hypothetical protein [Candidatus Margulisiibacteriota bacterium]
PDLKDRFIRGGTSSGASGGSNDSLSITLSEANLPSHKHSITDSGHTHNQNPHTHSQQPHSHTQNPHNHAQDSHSHPASYSGTRVQLGNDNGIAYASYAPGNGFSTATMAVTVSGTTATNQAATAANQNTSATNNDATAVNQSAYTGITETGTVGQNPPVPITVNVEPAYYTVIYIKKMA